MFTFRQSLKIGYCTTCGWCIIQLQRYFFIWLLIFEFPFRFGFNTHGLVGDLIALSFDLAAPTWRIAVFFFAYNTLLKRYSYFQELFLFTGVCIMVDMGLLLVNPSGVKTISASIISLNFCWSSNFLVCLYNLLMLWIHLCSKRALLLNDWSIPIVLT